MIITSESRKEINKKTMADLASNYATEFAHLLGYERDIRITQEKVISEKGEAREIFLKKFQPKTYSKPLKRIARIRYQDLKTKINNGLAFFQDGVAYIPITALTEEERGLVSCLRPDEATKIGFFDRMLLNKSEAYCSLNGFGSEIGHIVGDRIYQGRVHNGLGESLDIASQLLELSKNVQLLTQTTIKVGDLNETLTKHLEDYISKRREEIEIYETLLFEGDTIAKQKALQTGLCSPRNADFVVALLKKQYVMSTHYDGTILFIGVFDSMGRDLGKTYRRLGEILANPAVTNMETALCELGYSFERLEMYKGVFGKDIFERAKRISSAN
jgi:hypothetical protein